MRRHTSAVAPIETAGGAVMGQGKHGRTFDAGEVGAGRRPADRATLYHELAGAAEQPWTLYVVAARDRVGGRLSELACRTAAERARVLRAVRGARGFVAKVFLGASNRSPRESFDMEIGPGGVRTKVIGAYGDQATCRRFTTVASGLPLPAWPGAPELVGLRLDASDTYYMLSRKCDTPLDRHPFERPDELLEMARDVLESFARLHAGGVLHADVKLDNMVFCAAPEDKGKRFKLIDWGGSIEVGDLRRQYLASREPKNTASPMAWYAWGLGTRLTVKAFMLLHGRLYPRSFLTSLEYARFCASSLQSFTVALERVQARTPDERATRAAILDEHARSFDLYNLGLALAHLATSTPAGTRDPGAHARVMRLARALTHYADPDFVGNDAERALALVAKKHVSFEI
jgi:hypothetical protein